VLRELKWGYTDIVFALSVPDEIYCFVHDLSRDNQLEFSRQRDFEVRGGCLKAGEIFVTPCRNQFRPKEVFGNKVRRQSCLLVQQYRLRLTQTFFVGQSHRLTCLRCRLTLQIYLYGATRPSTSSDTSFWVKIHV